MKISSELERKSERERERESVSVGCEEAVSELCVPTVL